jgi:hypothetical protein
VFQIYNFIEYFLSTYMFNFVVFFDLSRLGITNYFFFFLNKHHQLLCQWLLIFFCVFPYSEVRNLLSLMIYLIEISIFLSLIK